MAENRKARPSRGQHAIPCDAVSDERIDPETLAAFLEGGLAPAERERVMRALAESPDAYADFLEAAAVARELDPQSSVAAVEIGASAKPKGTPVVPIAAKRRGTRWYVAPALIAAGIAAVVVVRLNNDGAGVRSVALAPSIQLVRPGSGSVAATLGDGWDQPRWSVVRGGESGVGDAARAFRAGARYAELEVAAQAGDAAAVARASESLARTAETVDAGAPVAAQLRAFAGDSARTRVADQLRSLLGAVNEFDAGVWTESARLALLANRLDFFAPQGEPISELKRLIATLDSTSPTVAPLRAIAPARTWTAADKDSLSRLVDAAIAAGAR